MTSLILLLLFLLLVSWFPRVCTPHEFVTRGIVAMSLALLWIAAMIPNPWIGLLLAVSAIGIWWSPNPLDTMRLIIFPGLPWILAYWLSVQYVNMAWIVPVLGMVAVIGSLQGCWMLYSVLYGGRYYVHHYRFYTLYEDHHTGMTAGQTNTNMMDGVAAVTTAAAVGLVYCHSLWWILAVFLCAVPVLVNQAMILTTNTFAPTHNTPTQGTVGLCCIGLACLPVFAGVWGWTLLGGLSVGTVFLTWGKPSLWVYRDVIWLFALKLWASMPVSGRLFGAGPGSWIPLYMSAGPTMPDRIATHPHNEYLHIFTEHGLVGILALGGYLVTSLWKLGTGTTEMQAVALTGWVLCAIAFISFPWTLYHEVAFMTGGDKPGRVNGHGTPTLNALTLAVMVLVEAA